jgi:2'-deoxynucleoside 5'-phosphate N-hydrolase
VLFVSKITKSIYVSGSLTDLTDAELSQLRKFYDQIAGVCREHDFEPYVPHHYGDPSWLKDLTPARIDRIDRLAVTQAYLVVAYVGRASTGVGIEIEIAHHANKPVVLMYERKQLEGRRVTRLARGNPAVVDEIVFEDYADCLKQLGQFLDKFHEKIKAENLPLPLSLTKENS